MFVGGCFFTGSPFPIEVLDVGAMSINWAPAKNVALHQTVSIDINTRGLNESNSEIKVTGTNFQNQSEYSSHIMNVGSSMKILIFVGVFFQIHTGVFCLHGLLARVMAMLLSTLPGMLDLTLLS